MNYKEHKYWVKFKKSNCDIEQLKKDGYTILGVKGEWIVCIV